jgi:nitrate reductase NapAB chaperone NapD
MAANSVISVTSLDFDAIKASMKSYISSKPEFTDYNFEGSTISMLLDLLAYNTYQNAFYTSMVGNEMFLDSAQLRESVVSRAKMLGYTPRSARGASTTLSVTITPNDAPDSITVAKNTEWQATVDGETYKFVTPDAYIITPAAGVYSSTITITEGRPVTHRWTVDSNNPVRYIIPNESVDTTSLVVDIQNSSEDSTLTRYTLASDITQVYANSAVYFLQETDDQQYEIYFGDDVIGKQPDNGNIIIAQYRICNGTIGNDISTFTDPSTLGGYSTFTATVNASTSGGANNESINSIKFNAPKNFAAQNRAVLAEDYKRIILRENGDFSSVNVWGGEDNTPPVYGKVYISVKPTTGNLISQNRKNQIKAQLKRYNILSIDPEFVDATYLYIRPTVTVRYDPTLTTLTAAQVQTKVLNAIVSFETNNLGTFSNNKFRFSRFTRAIDDTDPSIVSNKTTIQMEKRFVPSTSQATTYRLAFSNPIDEPVSIGHTTHAGSHHISSSAFTFSGKTAYLDDDGEGVVRSYYIQDSTSVVYLNETLGTVDYNTGLITLNSFFPTSISGAEMSIYADPLNNDINAVRNQILLIAGATVTVVDDTNGVVVAQTQQATTSGVTTTVVDSGVNAVVY